MNTKANHRREPWSIDDSEFYELESRTDEMEFLLRYAVLAPSGHNTQPWTFAIVPEGIEVFADYTRRLPHVDPGNRELMMSVGAAIMNLRVAAAHFGFESTVLYQRNARETAAVALVALRETCDPDASLRRLFPAIVRRRTNRQPFDGEPIDMDSLSSLCDIADEHPEFMHFLLPHHKARISELVEEADRLQMENRAVRDELADWVRPARTTAMDGISAEAFGIPAIFSSIAGDVIRRVDLGGMQARRDAALVGTTPLLILITAEDDPISLLQAGQVLERLLLTVTLEHLQYSFMNQPVQVAILRDLLAPIVRSPHPPQLLLRIGYAPPVEQPMPRRDVAEVLHED
ncbi:MAG TPA: nitroreductase [Thermoanaerobaculia bacterium]|nr:nitroreductase [Thermoanaerobaculia bacterium]